MTIYTGNAIKLVTPMGSGGATLNGTVLTNADLESFFGVRQNTLGDANMANGEPVKVDTDGDGLYADEANTTKTGNDRYLDSTATMSDGSTIGIRFELVTLSDGTQYILFADNAANAINGSGLNIQSITFGTFNNTFPDYYNGANFSNTISATIVCFAAGTRIMTTDGEVAVQDLRPGDLVRTADRGFKPLLWTGSTRLGTAELAAHPKLRPIRIKAGALGRAMPAADLIVSPQHRMLVRSGHAKRIFGADEILIPAIKLRGLKGVSRIRGATEVEYFHILFDRHEVVFANGAPSESLFLGSRAVGSLSKKARAEIELLFPELSGRHDMPGAARTLVHRNAQIDRLLARHRNSDLPLIGDDMTDDDREIRPASASRAPGGHPQDHASGQETPG